MSGSNICSCTSYKTGCDHLPGGCRNRSAWVIRFEKDMGKMTDSHVCPACHDAFLKSEHVLYVNMKI